MREATIEIDYIGGDLSVNHYLGRGKRGNSYVKSNVVAWKEELGWTVKPLFLDDWKLPLTVRCDGRFTDKRSCPDLSNLSKVCLDALEEASGVNDRDMRWEDGGITIDKNREPELTLTITEGES